LSWNDVEFLDAYQRKLLLGYKTRKRVPEPSEVTPKQKEEYNREMNSRMGMFKAMTGLR